MSIVNMGTIHFWDASPNPGFFREIKNRKAPIRRPNAAPSTPYAGRSYALCVVCCGIICNGQKARACNQRGRLAIEIGVTELLATEFASGA
jgi:hypothetical protein